MHVKCLQPYTRQHGSVVGSVRIVIDVEDVGARFVVIGACDLVSFTFSISCGTFLGISPHFVSNRYTIQWTLGHNAATRAASAPIIYS